jgi:hypothetical protein
LLVNVIVLDFAVSPSPAFYDTISRRKRVVLRVAKITHVYNLSFDTQFMKNGVLRHKIELFSYIINNRNFLVSTPFTDRNLEK